MAMNVNNFVIDRAVRGIMMVPNKNGELEYAWSINQITNPSINITTENSQAVDALGSVIAEFDRARNAEFTAENSIFDLGLYAAQLGQKKVVSDETLVPAFDDNADGATLAHLPEAGTLSFIYALNGDGTLGESYQIGTASGFTVSGQDVQFPTDVTSGRFMAVYEYKTSAVSVTANAIDFPRTGVFRLEVLGCDVCDQTKLVHAWIEFPNAKLDGNVDYSFTTDGTHPFTLRAMQSYCDPSKRLFTIVIPDED